MPYKDKEYHKQKYYPNQTLLCPMCQTQHERFGQTKRKSPVCESCYPIFRQAEVMLASIKYRSHKHNHAYDLDVKWLFDKLSSGICPKTGVKFNLNQKSPSMKDRPFDGPSVDKIDPDGGYLKENCQVVIWWYNCMKQRFTDDKVKELCKAVANG